MTDKKWSSEVSKRLNDAVRDHRIELAQKSGRSAEFRKMMLGRPYVPSPPKDQ